MGYREIPAPAELRSLVECGWVSDGTAADAMEDARILPDGCMDLIRSAGRVIVAGPDTAAFITRRGPEPLHGLRFRPGVLPRLLGVPAAELSNTRVDLTELLVTGPHRSLIALTIALAAEPPRAETTPWSLPVLHRITRRLADGATVSETARDTGWSSRSLQRHCSAVYGYGPAQLRRILRFRRAVRLLQSGLTPAVVAAQAGYADQPHLHRDVRALAEVSLRQLGSAANRSTEVPSGSSTVA